MQHYQLPEEKVKHFVVVIGTIFLLTINMCDRGRTITHLQIPRFHTQVWYKGYDYMAYIDYMDLPVRCPRKTIKLIHSLNLSSNRDSPL